MKAKGFPGNPVRHSLSSRGIHNRVGVFATPQSRQEIINAFNFAVKYNEQMREKVKDIKVKYYSQGNLLSNPVDSLLIDDKLEERRPRVLYELVQDMFREKGIENINVHDSDMKPLMDLLEQNGYPEELNFRIIENWIDRTYVQRSDDFALKNLTSVADGGLYGRYSTASVQRTDGFGKKVPTFRTGSKANFRIYNEDSSWGTPRMKWSEVDKLRAIEKLILLTFDNRLDPSEDIPTDIARMYDTQYRDPKPVTPHDKHSVSPSTRIGKYVEAVKWYKNNKFEIIFRSEDMARKVEERFKVLFPNKF